jgi:hypothetical protein
LPAEEVPPEIPEPALGINFARDGMTVSNAQAAVGSFLQLGAPQQMATLVWTATTVQHILE